MPPTRTVSTTLNLGGWDHTDRVGAGGITAANRDALVQHLRERHANAPWASAAVLPTGEFDAQGAHSKAPDAAAFDAFVRLWPDARHYMVFLAVGDWGSMTAGFAGSARGTPLFEAELPTWALVLGGPCPVPGAGDPATRSADRG